MSKGSILIIDNNTEFKQTAGRILRRSGIQVSTVVTMNEAVIKAKEQMFDLALLGINLPDIRGLELINELIKNSPDMVVVGLVDNNVSNNHFNASDSEWFVCLEKPTNLSYILDIVNIGLAKRVLVMENRRLKQELDSLRTELLANVSHELRTPLSAIKGYSTALLQPDVIFDRDTSREFLVTIDQEADRLERIIGDLLILSRLDSGTLTIKKEARSLIEIINGIKDNLYNLTKKHGLKIDVPENLPAVIVDDKIGAVFTNLVENAVKYSHEGSGIIIEAVPNTNNIIIRVIDKGVGIAPEYREKIFERFYQITNESTGVKSGTGLGLYICKGIIEAYGGNMWVESESGKGSKFCFTLPCLMEK